LNCWAHDGPILVVIVVVVVFVAVVVVVVVAVVVAVSTSMAVDRNVVTHLRSTGPKRFMKSRIHSGV
jgi:hypothetical protein